MPFVDPKSLRSKNVIYAGVPFGTQTVLSDGIYVPRVALTHFSSQPAHVTIETSSGRAQGAEENSATTEPITPKVLNLLLSAGDSKDVILDGQPESTGLQHSVMVKSDRLPGEVQSKLVSRSDGRLYEVEMLAKDEKTTENGGGHPWVTKGGTESHLLLFNHSSAVRIFGVSISNGVTVWNKRYSVAALGTRQLSIDRIIRDQVKDDDGNTLDPKYQDGVVSWSTANPEEGVGRLLMSNRNTAMAHNFSCGYTLVVCGLGLSVFNGGFVPIYSFTEYSSAAPVQYCYAWGVGACSNLTQGSGGGAAFTWQIGNKSVVNYNTSSDQFSPGPNFRGVSAGSTYASVTASENGCQSTGSGSPPPKVVACPTTLTRAASLVLPLAPLVPSGVLTGAGIVAKMQVGGSLSSYNGATITEAITQISNTCPASFGTQCVGNDSFMVGVNDDGHDTLDSMPTPATANVFWDNHTKTDPSNLLVAAGISSCTSKCSQTYTCGGAPLGTAFTITRSYTKGTVGSTAVTNVTTTKAP